MRKVFVALEEISTDYARFEKDQVLTEAHLNSVATYADDGARATRARLLGCGVLEGLEVRMVGDGVVLGRGLGVTTDGDLVVFDQGVTYTHFRKHDHGGGVYHRFFPRSGVHSIDPEPRRGLAEREGLPMLLLELLPKGQALPRDAHPLTAFQTEVGYGLREAVALIFVDSHVLDSDLCTSDGCDNLGKQVRNPRRLLLTHHKNAAALADGAKTPRRLWEEGLELFDVQRPLLSPEVDTASELASVYWEVCEDALSTLTERLPGLGRRCNEVVGAFDASADFGAWARRLREIRAAARGQVAGVQYLHGLLTDLVDAANELIDALYDERLWAHYELERFPKHLLLGRVGGGGEAAERTPWFPSPAACCGEERWAELRFLLTRIDVMISGFASLAPLEGVAPVEPLLSASEAAASAALRLGGLQARSGHEIRITPGSLDDVPLGSRAAPAYYSPRHVDIRRHWSFERARRGRAARVPCYHGNAGQAWLRRPLGRAQRFRIEGHQGMQVEQALEQIEGLIQTWNLPIAVKALALAREPRYILVPAKRPYTPLHKLHHVLRKDMGRQLTQVQRFAGAVAKDADEKKAILDGSQAVAPSSGFVATAHKHKQSLELHVPAVLEALSKGPGSSGSLGESYSKVLHASSGLKRELSVASESAHVTPADMVLGGFQPSWIKLIEAHIQAEDTQRDKQQLFSEFLRRHPGVEHLAGAPRGGTLLLVYDEDGVVVADFATSTICCEPELQLVEEAEEPTFEPPVYDEGVLHGGMVLKKPLVLEMEAKIAAQVLSVEDKIGQVQAGIGAIVDDKLGAQVQVAKAYQDALTSIVGMSNTFVSGASAPKAPDTSTPTPSETPYTPVSTDGPSVTQPGGLADTPTRELTRASLAGLPIRDLAVRESFESGVLAVDALSKELEGMPEGPERDALEERLSGALRDAYSRGANLEGDLEGNDAAMTAMRTLASASGRLSPASRDALAGELGELLTDHAEVAPMFREQ